MKRAYMLVVVAFAGLWAAVMMIGSQPVRANSHDYDVVKIC